VKVNRLELIEKLKAMVATSEARAAASLEEAYTRAAEAETNYVREHAGEWAKLADKIRVLNRRGQAITIGDVPEGLRGGSRSYPEVRVFAPITVKESDHLPRTEPLTRLITVLESCPDEFISTSSLNQIGAPLKDLMWP